MSQHRTGLLVRPLWATSTRGLVIQCSAPSAEKTGARQLEWFSDTPPNSVRRESIYAVIEPQTSVSENQSLGFSFVPDYSGRVFLSTCAAETFVTKGAQIGRRSR